MLDVRVRLEAVRVMFAAGDASCGLAALMLMGSIIVIVLVLASNQSKQLAQEAAKAAARLGGRFEGGSWGQLASIRYRACGSDAFMEFWTGGKNNPAYTRVSIDARGKSPGALKVYQEGFGTTIAKWFGAQDLEVGDPSFDALYVVKATPVSLVAQVFRAAERDEVLATIRRLGRWSNGSMDLSRESMAVKVMDCLRDADAMVELAGIAEGLYLKIVGGARGETGIVWGASTAGGGQCQVCGAALSGEVVKCSSCATPHHRECWQYVGECSTFGCKERRWV